MGTALAFPTLPLNNLGIKGCYYDTDYWAGAVKECKGVSKMPTMAELGKLTSQLYKGNPSVGAYETKSGLQWDQDAATSLGFISSGFWLWSGEESSSSSADYRIFSPAYSGWNSGRNGNSYGQAVCIVD